MQKILLVCGSGASSGFMAASMRKAAKKRGLDVSVTAKSDSEIRDLVNEIQILLIGPHLAYMADELKMNNDIMSKNIKIGVIPQEVYGTLDGEAALDFALNIK